MVRNYSFNQIPISRIILVIILIASLSIPYSFLLFNKISDLKGGSPSWFSNFNSLPQLPGTGGSIANLGTIIHLPPPTTDSWTSRAHLPSLRNFISRVENGQNLTVRGVYVPGFLALPVVQQPGGNSGYVSRKAETATQFQLAARNNVIGLLAHNYLSGKDFFRLSEGLQVMVVKGDGSIDRYRVTGVHELQKLSPGSNWSHYVDLNSGERLTTYQVFNQFYQGEHHLTFQTCLERDGLETWGLRFVVAEPVQ
jgi:hypothetical protein